MIYRKPSTSRFVIAGIVAEGWQRHEEAAAVAAVGGSVRQPLRRADASPKTDQKDPTYPSGESLPQTETEIPFMADRRRRWCGDRDRRRLVQDEQRRGRRDKDRSQRTP